MNGLWCVEPFGGFRAFQKVFGVKLHVWIEGAARVAAMCATGTLGAATR